MRCVLYPWITVVPESHTHLPKSGQMPTMIPGRKRKRATPYYATSGLSRTHVTVV